MPQGPYQGPSSSTHTDPPLVPADAPSAPLRGSPLAQTSNRLPESLLDVLRDRAALEGISQSELIAYAVMRLLQMETLELGELEDAQLRRVLEELQASTGSGRIAAWVQQWQTPVRASRLHPSAISGASAGGASESASDDDDDDERDEEPTRDADEQEE